MGHISVDLSASALEQRFSIEEGLLHFYHTLGLHLIGLYWGGASSSHCTF
jgi:hypothetical protein